MDVRLASGCRDARPLRSVNRSPPDFSRPLPLDFPRPLDFSVVRSDSAETSSLMAGSSSGVSRGVPSTPDRRPRGLSSTPEIREAMRDVCCKTIWL